VRKPNQLPGQKAIKKRKKKEEDDEDIWKGKEDKREVKDEVKIAPTTDLERLHDFARRGDKANVEEIWKKKKTIITEAGNQGYTAIHWGAFGGNAEVVEWLIDQKVNVNVTNQAGDTPLHIAAWKGHGDAVKLLIGKGKATNGLKNKAGKTPDQLATDSDVAALLSGGAPKIEVAQEEPDSDDDD